MAKCYWCYLRQNGEGNAKIPATFGKTAKVVQSVNVCADSRCATDPSFAHGVPEIYAR